MEETQSMFDFYHDNVVFLECVRVFVMKEDVRANARFRQRHTLVITSAQQPAEQLLKNAIHSLIRYIVRYVNISPMVRENTKTIVVSAPREENPQDQIVARVASLIRYCLINCIPSYAIGEIVDNDLEYALVNTSATTTEEIVGRASLVPLIVNTQNELLLENATITIVDENTHESDTRYTKSDKMLLSDADNLLLPTNPDGLLEKEYRLAILPAGAQISVSMYVERGTGKTHSKFQSTSKVTLYQNGELEYRVDFQLVGQHTHSECFNKVMDYINDQQYVSIQQVKEVEWLPCVATKDPSVWYRPFTTDVSWIPLQFCQISTSATLLELKEEFGMIPVKQRNRKRDQVNPFSAVDDIKRTGKKDTSNHQIFMDRAASKIIEIDTTMRLLDTAVERCIASDSVEKKIIVADIASGPGSWSEYILWRTGLWESDQPSAHVYGFTLVDNRQQNHFRIPCDIANGRFTDLSKICGGTGNVTLARESKRLVGIVNEAGQADIVLCDGGSPDHEKNQDELANVKLIRGEFAAAIGMLKNGGSMVCKLFMTETKETLATLSIVAECFKNFTITKPVASRPSNSEQYFVGLGFDANMKHQACERLWAALEFGHTDVLEVPTALVSYINHNNAKRALLQSEALENIIMQRVNVDRAVQLEIKEVCMTFWGIPTSLHGIDDQPTSDETEVHGTNAAAAGNQVDDDGRDVVDDIVGPANVDDEENHEVEELVHTDDLHNFAPASSTKRSREEDDENNTSPVL